MARPRKANWWLPGGLIALSGVPVLAGAMRLGQLATGGVVSADNERFFAAPWPVTLHLIGATLYCVIGALQFAPGLRQRHPVWHRQAGRVLVACGLAAALSGLWMAAWYPPGATGPARFDGPAVQGLRLLAGTAMALCLGWGLAAVRRRDIPGHQAWMLRAYALGLGAGTQVLTHLPWFLLPGIQGTPARALCMAAGWLINLTVAEWLIRRVRR
jgi:uncharacterized membrane protein